MSLMYIRLLTIMYVTQLYTLSMFISYSTFSSVYDLTQKWRCSMGNDKLLRTDFIRLKNMLIIFDRRYAKTNDESASIQEVIKAIDRRLSV